MKPDLDKLIRFLGTYCLAAIITALCAGIGLALAYVLNLTIALALR